MNEVSGDRVRPIARRFILSHLDRTEKEVSNAGLRPAVSLSFGPIGQDFTTSVTEACARRPGTAASVSRRRRERRILLAGGGRRASRSHTLGASQAFERMHTLSSDGSKT